MKDRNAQGIVFRYTISGFVIGILTVVFVLIVDFFIKDISFSQMVDLHKENPVYLILDLSPFVLAFYAYILSRRYAESSEALHSSLKHEFDKGQKIYRFVEKLRHGMTNASYKVQGEDDVLGQSILELRDSLNDNRQAEEKRRKEDEQRNWVAEGLTMFGDILRKDTDNLEELSYNIISSLVKYIGANQGAFFIIDDESEAEPFLDMKACYAYERRKFPEGRLELGEGIIGASVLEKETVYMTNVPETYVHITSGLGQATPRAVLIVPLQVNEEVYGVMEIGTFEMFDQYVLDFVERVAENVASTISNVKINSRTARLLQESREQAETLAAQEEQMRQNMEELQATQEEAARQSEKFVTFTNAVNHTLIRAEYDPDGTLLYANTKFLQKLGYERNGEVEGRHISMFINEKDRDWFDDLWTKLANGGKHFEGDMKHVTKQGRDLWTMSTYTCMRRDDGSVEKILFLAIDTTHQKKQSLDYQGQIQALNRASMKIEFLPTGDVLECNQRFLDLLGYSLFEMKEKTIYDFVKKSQLNQVRDIWTKVSQGESWEGTLQMFTKEEENKWTRATLSPVKDMYEDLSKIIFIGNDITNEKEMELEAQKQTELLKKQEEELRMSRLDLRSQLKQAKEDVKQQFKAVERLQLQTERTLEGAADAIVTIDQENVVTFFNKAAEELWNIGRDEVLGRSVQKLFPQEDIEDDFLQSYLDPQADKIIGERKEVTIYDAKGEEKSVIFLLSQARVGDTTSYTAFIQNISVDLF
jgi:PAS domain S-box-containing protein